MSIVKLRDDQFIRQGDLVTIGKDEESGFREFCGAIGVAAGVYTYPIYRDLSKYCEHDRRFDMCVECANKTIGQQAARIKELEEKLATVTKNAALQALNQYNYIGELQQELEALKIENERLKASISNIHQAATNAPELNMGNYTEDQVAELNNAMITVWQLTGTAVEKLTDPTMG